MRKFIISIRGIRKIKIVIDYQILSLKDLFRFGNSGYVLKDLADQKKVEELIKQKQRSGWDAKYLANEQKEKDRQ